MVTMQVPRLLSAATGVMFSVTPPATSPVSACSSWGPLAARQDRHRIPRPRSPDKAGTRVRPALDLSSARACLSPAWLCQPKCGTCVCLPPARELPQRSRPLAAAAGPVSRLPVGSVLQARLGRALTNSPAPRRGGSRQHRPRGCCARAPPQALGRYWASLGPGR